MHYCEHKVFSGVAINTRSFGADRKTNRAGEEGSGQTEIQVIFLFFFCFATKEARARSRFSVQALLSDREAERGALRALDNEMFTKRPLSP